MDTTDKKDGQKQSLTDEQIKLLSQLLLKKFQKDFKKILTDFNVHQQRDIVKTFLEIAGMATDLVLNFEGRDPWNHIEMIYTEKLIEKYNEKFAKAEKTGIINYFSRTRILKQTTKLDGFNELGDGYIAVNDLSNEKIINLSIFFDCIPSATGVLPAKNANVRLADKNLYAKHTVVFKFWSGI